MIELCYPADEQSRLGPFGWGSFVAELEATGLTFHRVDHPAGLGIVLLFAPLEGTEVVALPPDVRTRAVLVVEGDRPVAKEAEAARESAGLLGLVEPDAWRKWQSGLLVAWGLYGREDIAKAAGLAALGTQGLQPLGTRESLTEVLARFLIAAERLNAEPAWKRTSSEPGYALCPACAGRGFCHWCDGTGKRGGITGRCSSCHGQGQCVVCEGDGQVPEEVIEMMDGPAPNRGTVSAQRQESSMIEVKADEARANGLPAMGLRVDPQGAPLSLMKFPEPGKYLIASGPPGAPLLAIVWAADEREGDTGAIEKAVRRHFSQPFQQPLAIGDAGSVTIGGASRPALAFMTGQSLRKTAWCGVLVSGQSGSVLVTLGCSPGQAASMSCADIVAEPSLAAFARTFALV